MITRAKGRLSATAPMIIKARVDGNALVRREAFAMLASRSRIYGQSRGRKATAQNHFDAATKSARNEGQLDA
jgi:hypothetical protein